MLPVCALFLSMRAVMLSACARCAPRYYLHTHYSCLCVLRCCLRAHCSAAGTAHAPECRKWECGGAPAEGTRGCTSCQDHIEPTGQGPRRHSWHDSGNEFLDWLEHRKVVCVCVARKRERQGREGERERARAGERERARERESERARERERVRVLHGQSVLHIHTACARGLQPVV